MRELVRRKLPFSHRARIGTFEVDFLVGERIIIEVDGYVHALKENIVKDQYKEEYLESLGFLVLRITSLEAKTRGLLREFGALVQQRYHQELIRCKEEQPSPLKYQLPQDELSQLRKEIVAKSFVQPKTETKRKERTDEELFLEAIEKLGTGTRRKNSLK